MRVALAQTRLELRKIDANKAAIRHETDFYRRIGFGRDIKNIQLMALDNKKITTEARLDDLERKLKSNRTRKTTLTGWLLLPVLLVLLAVDALAPKRRSPREQFLETRWRHQPRPSFDLG